MDRENIVHILVAIVAIYGLVLIMAALGGGIELSLGTPLYKFPIVLPKEALYVFLVVFAGVSILESELVDKWVNAGIGLLIAAFGLFVIQGTPGMGHPRHGSRCSRIYLGLLESHTRRLLDLEKKVKAELRNLTIYFPKGTRKVTSAILYLCFAYMGLSSLFKIVTGQAALYSLTLVILILAVLPFLMQLLILVGIIKVVESVT